jgi:hypothetical protein
MTNEDEPRVEILLRRTRANHGEAPPECDQICRLRWQDQPHPHLCTDGLMDDTPYMTITTWCSCGFRLQGPLHLDAGRDSFTAAAEQALTIGPERFVAHAREAHGIDVTQDEDWQTRLTTWPGPPAPPE